MDVLSALLPPSPPPMAVTVNGRPLAEVLTVVANALRAQQEDIRQFRMQHSSDMAEVARRFEAVEARVTRLETDLQIQRRPFAAYGQPHMPTAYDAIASIEYRVHRSSTAVRLNAEADIGAAYAKGVLQRYFKKLFVYAALRVAVRRMAADSRSVTLAAAMRRWAAGAAVLKARRAAERKVAALRFVSDRRIVGVYFGKYIEWHKDLNARLAEKRARDQRVANELAAYNLRGTVRRFFAKWSQYQGHFAFNANRYRAAQRLEVANHQRTALRAYEAWAEFTNYRLFEVRRHRAIATRQKQSLRALVLRYLATWQRFVAVQQARQSAYVLVTRMNHAATMRLARRYFEKILRFVTLTQQRRRTEEIAAYLTLLAKKYDSLGAQLDLSLDNLSHTNGVLSRVVDTIILTNPDAPQVRSLLTVHRGDQTTGARLTTQRGVEGLLAAAHHHTINGAGNSNDNGIDNATAAAFEEGYGSPADGSARLALGHQQQSHTSATATAAAKVPPQPSSLPSRHQDEAAPHRYPYEAALPHTLTVPPPRHATPAQSLTRALAANSSGAGDSRATSAQRSHSGGVGLPSVANRRQRVLSPGSSRENPERRVMNVRELISQNNSPQRRI